MLTNKPSDLFIKAVAPPPTSESAPKELLSMRVELCYVQSLKSMAARIGKAPSALAAELIEHAIQECSDNLGTFRPDLLREINEHEADYASYVAANTGDDSGFLPRPTWTTPEEARAAYSPVSGPSETETDPTSLNHRIQVREAV